MITRPSSQAFEERTIAKARAYAPDQVGVEQWMMVVIGNRKAGFQTLCISDSRRRDREGLVCPGWGRFGKSAAPQTSPEDNVRVMVAESSG